MRRSLTFVVCLTLALAGCKAKELVDQAGISKDLDKRGTTDLMKEVANDTYDPPADGKLTDAQIKMYLKVREHEKQIVQVARKEAEQHAQKAKKSGEKSIAGMMAGLKTLGSVADMVTADLRAAKDLGYNTQEYLWVKQQLLAVSGAAMADKMGEALNAGLNQAYEQTKKAHDQATDATTKKMYADMLAAYDKQRAEGKAQQQDQDPAIAHNRALYQKYENELNVWATEMAKWENKPGEMQKSVADWEKQLEEAKKKQP
jgi:hypothetical protein